MISARELRNNCRTANYQRGRDIADRPSRILAPTAEETSVRGVRRLRLSARMRGTDPGDMYETEVFIDPVEGEILDYDCTCPAADNFSGMCKHAVGLVMRYNDASSSFRSTGNARARQTSGALSLIMDRTAPGPRQAQANVDLDMELSYYFDQWTLQFKIVGPKGSYVLKNIGDFLDHMRAGDYVSYGKKLAFSHVPGNLTPRARKIWRFLDAAVEARRELAPLASSGYSYGYSYGYSSAVRVGREMQLANSELLDLFGIFEGEQIDILDEEQAIEAQGAYLLRTGRSRGRLARDRDRMTVTVREGKPELGISIEAVDGGFEVSAPEPARVVSDGQRLALWRGDTIWLCPPSFASARKVLDALYGDGALFVAADDAPRFASTVLPVFEDVLGAQAPAELDALKPVPCELAFYLDRTRTGVVCDARAVYGGRSFHVLAPITHEDAHVRDPESEAAGAEAVRRYFAEFVVPKGEAGRTVGRIAIDDADAIGELLFGGLAAFRELGQVFTTPAFDKLLFDGHPTAQTGLSISGDLINLDISADELEPEEVARILDSYRLRRRYHRLKNGAFLNVGDMDLAQIDRLSSDLGIKGSQLGTGEVELPLYEAFYLKDRLPDADRDESFSAYLDRFDEERAKKRVPPASLAGILRPYQVEGFAWLSLLTSCGFGGILADEMGLGKSVQLISWLVSCSDRADAPSLIVCPASLVYNWAAEFERFAPQMRIATLAGAKAHRVAERARAAAGEVDVMITSYDILRIDVEDFAQMKLFSCTLDEAQYIKNQSTKVAKAAKRVRAQHRFALTGTPVENRPSELWSIFDFLMPGLLGSAMHFRERFEIPVLGNDEEAQKSLQALVGPFVLRRLKANVLTDLPDKMESRVYAQMTGPQAKAYQASEQHLRDALNAQKRESGSRSHEAGANDMNKVQVLAQLTRLRQLCLDPALVFENYKGGAAKLDTIVDLVGEGIESGQKILVFSQFTSFLKRIAARLEKAGVSYFTITGATPKKRRLELVNEFNANDVPVFLISLKAGGTGLNLTGASMVIHADPWWNAAAENQATDRAHRIGQERTVSVYKVIAKGTIEERIVDLQERKSELAHTLLAGSGASLAKLSTDDLIALLS
ncbi:DEAD/DEAH box helicase [Hugonella massiliensis]|uniref:DEAD/DEAH box helicase n=1 Tax=Hugonella massiliensis TaxID=1720315 RepID=UPI00073ECC24|nr:DEAD/DEAH box helicase [Hugonella massiliensis]